MFMNGIRNMVESKEDFAMSEDPEIRAMASVADIPSNLDGDAVQRILRWAAQRFNISLEPEPSRSARWCRAGQFQHDRFRGLLFPA